MKLRQYVHAHTIRTACRCGQCFEAQVRKVKDAPKHTVNVGFFDVSLNGAPSVDEFRRLVNEHCGVFAEIDPFDDNIHMMEDVGGWLGDQETALRFIGLGQLLGLWASVASGGTVAFTARLKP